MDFVNLPISKIPVKHKTQVLVLGGGPAGVSAATSASKHNADVMLIERYGFLGGQSTGGLVIILCGLNDCNERIIKGFCQKTIDYLDHYKATKPWNNFIIFQPEVLKRCFDDFIVENNIKLLLNTYAVNVIKSDNEISHVIVENKGGRSAIQAEVIIDCTGDADALSWANEDFEQATREKARPVTACFRVGGVDTSKFKAFSSDKKDEYTKIIKQSGLSINPYHLADICEDGFMWFDMSHINNIDIVNPEDLTAAELKTRQYSWKIFEFYKEHIPGFEKSFMIDIAPLLGVRDSRRIKGQYFITSDDYEKSFNDCISYAPYYFSTNGIGKLQIPYRALLPVKTKNLIVAGRSIGIEHKLIDCIREIPCCMATGQAAGIAASIAVNNSKDFKQVSIEELKKGLIAQGAYI